MARVTFGNKCSFWLQPPRLGKILEYTRGSTTTGSLWSHGPGSSDDNRNTRRRLDTSSSPADEHARSAVLLRFPCEQYHTGITKWINTLWERSNMPADSWLTKSKFSSLIEMTKVHSSSQHSTLAHMSSASKIEDMELENPVFKLALLGSGQTFTFVTPELSVPGVSPDVLQRVLSQANKVYV